MVNPSSMLPSPLLETALPCSIKPVYDYNVVFTEEAFNSTNSLLNDAIGDNIRRRQLAIFIDSGLAAYWPHLTTSIRQYCQVHHLQIKLMSVHPAGEACKDWDNAHLVWKQLMDAGVDRHNTVIAIGGGALLDLIGYCASSYHRGVDLIRMPTTVLSQNDSGVGVKNGINAFGQKNFIGNFAPPKAVINDFKFIDTLDARDKRAGLAEAIKVALIKDAGFFQWLCDHQQELANFDRNSLNHSTVHSATLHARHIASGGDPFEATSKRPLDFGHWSAHKLECLTHHEVRHGEAVAIGICLDSYYSLRLGTLQLVDFFKIIELVKNLGFKIWHPALMSKNSTTGKFQILEGLEEFRQHLGGTLNIPVLDGIGCIQSVSEMNASLIIDGLYWLQNLEQNHAHNEQFISVSPELLHQHSPWGELAGDFG